MNPKEINVCFCFDKDLVHQVLVTVWSCVQNSSSKIIFHLIHTEDCEQYLKECIQHVQIHRISCKRPELDFRLYPVDENTVEQFPETTFSKLTCVRLLIHKILPKDITRVIYLDGDMLVTGDLSDISNIDLRGFPIAAVEETYNLGTKLKLLHIKEIGFTGDRYFNAGMLIIDMEKFAKMGVGDQCVALLQKNPTPYQNPDQDTLNLICSNNWLELDGRWNNVGLTHPRATNWSILFRRTKLRTDIPKGILHFLGNQKPWRKNCYSQARFAYLKLARTLFPNFKVEPFPTIKTRMLMYVPIPIRNISKYLINPRK